MLQGLKISLGVAMTHWPACATCSYISTGIKYELITKYELNYQVSVVPCIIVIIAYIPWNCAYSNKKTWAYSTVWAYMPSELN